ncbi:Endo-1-3(4)-beta-glucanase [Penicillium odoratum]|uniref:Endo-1-3(4)-beta-glucanase n=1 Tax=Penicillium odoratum TaxID=1167516 RepID=UPI0025483673|nr:Endo-1-3(4)-beta-glucanase [Penicillium odoratum]KAJ5746247.1 Endo-1-3(4)-beta-glucanase [Penicillium odoratum]
MKRDVPYLGILSLACILFFALVSAQSDSKVNASLVTASKKNPKECDCYTVSGTDPGYFQHYKLWDFRSVPLRQLDTAPPEPEEHEDEWTDLVDAGDDYYEDDDDEEAGDNQNPQEDSLFFYKTAFDEDWVSQGWHRPGSPKAPVTMVNSKRNVFITRDHEDDDPEATYLVLRTVRHPHFTSTAEIETRVHNIFRCSLRIRLRILPASMQIAQPPSDQRQPPPDPNQSPTPAINNEPIFGNTTSPLPQDTMEPPSGACVGVFTYHAKNCESDIEILTSDPINRVRYANQPDYDPVTDRMIPGAATIADLEVPWTSWSTHRLDWLGDRSRWYVNNKLEEVKSYRVPNLQSRLVINLWSDGGSWTGDMHIGDKIFLGIEYIELAYNQSSDGNDAADFPPEKNHGGHQRPFVDTAGVAVDDSAENFGNESEIVTGATAKKKSCKKGKKGRKCRKKKKHGKHRKPGKGGKNTEPRCRRVCNIDELQFASKN